VPPIYELRCTKCKTEFEFFKLRSDERAECPKCKEKEEKYLEKKVSTDTGFTLRGRGWYKDGY